MYHKPRLFNLSVKGETAFCKICEKTLRNLNGTWEAVWSGSQYCTGIPVRISNEQ